MSFNRFQKHQHSVAGKTVCVSYDRFTTKFEVQVDNTVTYSKHFLFWPKHSAIIQMGSRSYLLDVCWCFIWAAKLKQDDLVVIKELLPIRRRRSISMLGYGIFIVLVRVAFVALAV